MLLAVLRGLGFVGASGSAHSAWRSAESSLRCVLSACSPFAQQTHGAERLCTRTAPRRAATLAHTPTSESHTHSSAAYTYGACCAFTVSLKTCVVCALRQEAWLYGRRTDHAQNALHAMAYSPAPSLVNAGFEVTACSSLHAYIPPPPRKTKRSSPCYVVQCLLLHLSSHFSTVFSFICSISCASPHRVEHLIRGSSLPVRPDLRCSWIRPLLCVTVCSLLFWTKWCLH